MNLPRLTIACLLQLVEFLRQTLRPRIRMRAHHEKCQTITGVGYERPVRRIRAGEMHGIRIESVPAEFPFAADHNLELIAQMEMGPRDASGIELCKRSVR